MRPIPDHRDDNAPGVVHYFESTSTRAHTETLRLLLWKFGVHATTAEIRSAILNYNRTPLHVVIEVVMARGEAGLPLTLPELRAALDARARHDARIRKARR